MVAPARGVLLSFQSAPTDPVLTPAGGAVEGSLTADRRAEPASYAGEILMLVTDAIGGCVWGLGMMCFSALACLCWPGWAVAAFILSWVLMCVIGVIVAILSTFSGFCMILLGLCGALVALIDPLLNWLGILFTACGSCPFSWAGLGSMVSSALPYDVSEACAQCSSSIFGCPCPVGFLSGCVEYISAYASQCCATVMASILVILWLFPIVQCIVYGIPGCCWTILGFCTPICNYCGTALQLFSRLPTITLLPLSDALFSGGICLPVSGILFCLNSYAYGTLPIIWTLIPCCLASCVTIPFCGGSGLLSFFLCGVPALLLRLCSYLCNSFVYGICPDLSAASAGAFILSAPADLRTALFNLCDRFVPGVCSSLTCVGSPAGIPKVVFGLVDLCFHAVAGAAGQICALICEAPVAQNICGFWVGLYNTICAALFLLTWYAGGGTSWLNVARGLFYVANCCYGQFCSGPANYLWEACTSVCWTLALLPFSLWCLVFLTAVPFYAAVAGCVCAPCLALLPCYSSSSCTFASTQISSALMAVGSWLVERVTE
jgi:hypothetical protein